MVSLNMVRVLSILGFCLFATAMIFIYSAVIENWDTISSVPPIKSYKYLFSGALALQVYWLYQVTLWRWIIGTYGERVSYLDSCIFFFSNSFFAYIPGKIANIIGIAVIAERTGFSPRRAVTTVLLFQIYALISGTAVVALMGVIVPRESLSPGINDWLWVFGIASTIGLLMVAPNIQRITWRTLGLAMKRNLEVQMPPFSRMLLQILSYGAGWFLPCLALWFFFKALLPEGAQIYFPLVMLVFVASYLLGLISVFVPAGLGVLEAGLVLGLTPDIGTNVVLWGAAVFRLVVISTLAISLLIVWKARSRAAR